MAESTHLRAVPRGFFADPPLGAENGWPPAAGPEEEDAWNEARHRAIGRNIAAAGMISRYTDEDLAHPLRADGPTRWLIIQGPIAHTAYHTGQILLTRQLQGAWTVEWRERLKLRAEP